MIGYPNSAKAVKDDKKVRPFRKHGYNSTWIQYQTNENGARAFIGNFLCGLETVKLFVKVHLHYIFRNLKKDKQNVDVAPLEKFLRTPMMAGMTHAMGATLEGAQKLLGKN